MRTIKATALVLFTVLSIPFKLGAVRAGGAVANAAGPAEAVALTIGTSSGQQALTLSEIEALGLRRVTTRSPWEAGELNVDGVLLRDVLRLVGLDKAAEVTVRGIDDYTQAIPKEDWEEWPLLLATRQDGQPLTPRTQGPTRIVYPLNDYPELNTLARKARWVWTIEAIEAQSE